MSTIKILSAVVLAGNAVMTGCGRSNGLPRDITRHLAARGIISRVRLWLIPSDARGEELS